MFSCSSSGSCTNIEGPFYKAAPNKCDSNVGTIMTLIPCCCDVVNVNFGLAGLLCICTTQGLHCVGAFYWFMEVFYWIEFQARSMLILCKGSLEQWCWCWEPNAIWKFHHSSRLCNKCICGLDIEFGLHLITSMDTFWTQANVLSSIMISCMSPNTADLYTGLL